MMKGKERGKSRKGNYVQIVKLIMSHGPNQEIAAGSLLANISDIDQYIERKSLTPLI
jgi:hypothetical protein